MKDRLLQFMKQKTTVQQKDITLLAVSAGIDSVVLCHLFKVIEYPFAIGHCNFKLRGEDSDRDEIFVEQLAEKLGVPFHSTSFETMKVATKEKVSIQKVARDLRYAWFEKITKEFDYQHIATAHHLNDSIETVLFNLTKGCGIQGLHGILPQRDALIRPLLFATKAEIKRIASKNNWTYREDVSNKSDKYSRNKIRHHVVPALTEINPAFAATFQENIQRFREIESIYQDAIEQYRQQLTFEKEGLLYIDIAKLKSIKTKQSVLYEILKPYGFINDITQQIIAALDGVSGKQFYSARYVALLDRVHLIVKPQVEEQPEFYWIDEDMQLLELPNEQVLIEKIKIEAGTDLAFFTNVVYLDLETLTFPLQLRRWQQGDIFQPYGMNGKQMKVSKLFKNLKLSIFEKEQIWIVESNKEICWVANYRLDERFKLTTNTKVALKLQIKKVIL